MTDTVVRVVAALRRVAVAVLLLPVHVWRATAVMRQPRCRYHPSCSTYAVGALRTHGPVRGSGLALWRLLRCHPWSPGGIDPVPARSERRFMSTVPVDHRAVPSDTTNRPTDRAAVGSP